MDVFTQESRPICCYGGLPHKRVTQGSHRNLVIYLFTYLLVEMRVSVHFTIQMLNWLAISNLHTLHSNQCFDPHPL